MTRRLVFSIAFLAVARVALAQHCTDCETWNAPHAPVRLVGNTYYVGTNGLSALLITSEQGHVLIDGGLPESAPRILDNIKALGFRIEDVKVVLNSHAHFDHAGGIAALQRASGARVIVSAASARELRAGDNTRDDPQFGIGIPYPKVERLDTIADGDTVHVGTLALVAHATAGHTPGGTSWSWRSCDGTRCLDFVYADSQTPVSADDFFYTRSTTYPNGVKDFEHGQSVLESLRCDVLVTPHPGASNLWERVAKGTLVDSNACKAYARAARAQLAARLAKERAGRP